MMITFSMSCAMDWLRSLRGVPHFTLYSVAPALDGLAQLEVGEHPRQEGQPEGEGAVDEHRDDRQARVDAEGSEGADHAALDPSNPARHGEQVGQHADEERLDEDRGRR